MPCSRPVMATSHDLRKAGGRGSKRSSSILPFLSSAAAASFPSGILWTLSAALKDSARRDWQSDALGCQRLRKAGMAGRPTRKPDGYRRLTLPDETKLLDKNLRQIQMAARNNASM
jgi:hypothetical protein